jgi:ABC-type nitrate/sulfonate/bicarbonate transport system permease component
MDVLQRLGRIGFYYSPLLILALVWEAMARSGVLPADLGPSPWETLVALKTLYHEGDLIGHAATSFWREFAGFVSSCILGTAVGVGMARVDWVRTVFRPIVTFLYPMPKSALIPLLLLWFGIGHMSKIAAIFLGCLLPVVTSAYNGARGVEPQLIWSARSLGTSNTAILWKIVLPAALPDILSGVRIALSLSWLLLVSAELLISRSGLGYLISYTGESGDYSTMFAAILVVVIIGFLADRIFLHLMRWVLRYRDFTG